MKLLSLSEFLQKYLIHIEYMNDFTEALTLYKGTYSVIDLLSGRGPPGDLFVYLDVEERSGIQRDGINLSSIVSISYLDAILGAVVKVKLLQVKSLAVISISYMCSREVV